MNIDKKLYALYNYVNCSTGSQRKKLLDILLATASAKQIKIAYEELKLHK